ncbi:MAG: branched-chain amino acid transport [Rhizobiales bacterium 65-79]|jgi:branched-subunit amino acid transport protein|nr:AzlD domain-containing protein [Hyphomicrobiales bacterium]OJU06835.1 MAG: branched-chain amino acid transport [Rhizobiales bacterium 65-79]
MNFSSIDAWWWPFLFILIAGWAVTDCWRYLGVVFGGRLGEDSEVLVVVRAVATALVAGVVGNLIFFPTGALATTPVAIRVVAVAAGFAAYLALGRKIIIGIVAAEAVFAILLLATG